MIEYWTLAEGHRRPEYLCGACAAGTDATPVDAAEADEFDEGLVCDRCGTELQPPIDG